jgi:predicted nucleic acid-binding protein
MPPYDRVRCPPNLLEIAEARLREARSLHCRALDRLHLAAMEGLGVRRLFTNDEAQALAACALAFEVVFPR